MESIKAFSKAAFLSAALAFAPAGLLAETITQSDGVTTIRGVDDAAAANQRQTSRARSGVTVFRGTSVGAQPAPIDVPAPVQPVQVTSGKNLWFYDPATGDITGCSFWYNSYGDRLVRCDSDRY